jgi:hypothetical protein
MIQAQLFGESEEAVDLIDDDPNTKGQSPNLVKEKTIIENKLKLPKRNSEHEVQQPKILQSNSFSTGRATDRIDDQQHQSDADSVTFADGRSSVHPMLSAEMNVMTPMSFSPLLNAGNCLE